jgi:hypothetical protein
VRCAQINSEHFRHKIVRLVGSFKFVGVFDFAVADTLGIAKK